MGESFLQRFQVRDRTYHEGAIYLLEPFSSLLWRSLCYVCRILSENILGRKKSAMIKDITIETRNKGHNHQFSALLLTNMMRWMVCMRIGYNSFNKGGFFLCSGKRSVLIRPFN